MKKLLALLLCVLMLTGSVAYAQLADGSYTGASSGFGGTVSVELTVEQGKIAAAVVDASAETASIGGAAVVALQESIVANQGAPDTVAGATVTSDAVKNAVTAALAAAKGEQVAAINYVPGTYTGTAKGMLGYMTVNVTVSENAIEQIEVTECTDTAVISAAAIREMPQRIVNHQSLAVDVASGATASSNAILGAVKNALSQASDNLALLSVPLEKKAVVQLPDESYDVVIVGAGGAGLAAAVEIGRLSDYSVLVLDKSSWIGGSTALSGGGIFVRGMDINEGKTSTYIINKDGKPLDCTPEEAVAYFTSKVKSMTHLPEDMWVNEEMIYRVFEKSPDFYDYMRSEGLLQLAAVSPVYFEGDHRGYMGMIPGGNGDAGTIWSGWFSDLARKNGAEIRLNSKVTALTGENNTVTGVTVEGPEGNYTVHAKKVVLATGGYGADMDRVRADHPMFSEILETAWSYCAGTCDGDAIAMVEPFDAAMTGYGLLTQYGVSQPYAFGSGIGDLPTSFELYVDENGNRYCDETEWYFNKLDDWMDQGCKSYVIIPHSDDESFTANISECLKNGWAVEGENIEDLAVKMGVDPANLMKSAEEYNEGVAAKPLSDFGAPRPTLDPQAKVYAVQMQLVILDTIYGVKQNELFQVLNNSGSPIDNLFAAGAVGFGNFMLEQYYGSTTAIGIAVYGGALAADQIVAELNAQ